MWLLGKKLLKFKAKVMGNHCCKQNMTGKDIKDRAVKGFQKFELIP